MHSLNRKPDDTRYRLQKIDARRLADIPAQTATNMAASVRTFERWLWERHEGERRAITEIAPVQLDYYLQEFFESIVTPSGTPYKAESFGALRNFLCLYLKETNYPEDIKTSSVFRGSEIAFRERKKSLFTATRKISLQIKDRTHWWDTSKWRGPKWWLLTYVVWSPSDMHWFPGIFAFPQGSPLQ